MEIEQLEIRDYLARCPPLDRLNDEWLDRLVNSLEISYVRRNSPVLKIGERNRWLYLLRSGAVEVFDKKENLIGRFGAGEWAGYRSLLRGGEVTLSITAIEDALLYLIPDKLFHQLISEHKTVADFFATEKTRRLRSATQTLRNTGDTPLLHSRARDLLHRPPLLVEHGTTIGKAARLMREHAASAMLVMKNDRLTGIVTDRAFCTTAVADSLSVDLPVTQIMTPDPYTITPATSGLEALLKMARHNICHLPVLDGSSPVGIISAADLIRHQSHNPLYLINEIHRADDLAGLQQLSRQLPQTLTALVKSGLPAYDIGHAISSIGEAVTRRLLKMAEQKLGHPPVPYAWITAGSLARDEQTALSDQDNALLLADSYCEQQHGKYFSALSQLVCDGLNECGYAYCPGEVMATNPKWRQPCSVWRDYFTGWIETPDPKALMHAAIFFDLRSLHGDAELLAELNREVLKKSRANTIFQTLLAANALRFQPPIGLFRNFVLEKTGAEKKAMDLKKRGTVPITDLVRVYALSAGISELNTRDRLEACAQIGGLSQSGMEDLRDAFEFISTVRLRHQCRQFEQGETPDNLVVPEQLSSLEKRHLKDAFELVRTMQSAMKMRYQTA